MLETKGILYMGNTKPVADRATDGTFRLTLLLIENRGGNDKEGYRVRWSGPQAQAFWQQHQQDLVSGANVYVELSHIRPHVGGTRPPMPELHARVRIASFRPRREHTHLPAATAA